jgi:hypothetical protein
MASAPTKRRNKRQGGKRSPGSDAPAIAAPATTPAIPAGGPLGRRLGLFAALCAVCIVLAGGYILLTAVRTNATAGGASAAPGTPAAGSAAPSLDSLLAQSHVVFRSSAQGASSGQVTIASLARPQDGWQATELRCERVYFAAGQGVCLAAERGVLTTYKAILFDDAFQARHTLPLDGIPSRTRISPDGRYAAMTVFVSGHSYAQGGFSTHTTIVDLATGTVLGDLEQFTVLRDGERIQAPDFNFWGVTFAQDSNRYYATLGTAGKTYLVEGDVAAREMRVLREGVECPSLSPDNRRLAYKKRVDLGGLLVWQVAVLDLATMRETVLIQEKRSVDDQVEWLDDQHVVYGLPAATGLGPLTDVWVMPVDGSAPPELFLRGAWSPAVVRT